MTYLQANHGGVKGKIPSELANQDPAVVGSQNEEDKNQTEDDKDSDWEEEVERGEVEEQEGNLNESDDDEEDTVRIKKLIMCFLGTTCLTFNPSFKSLNYFPVFSLRPVLLPLFCFFFAIHISVAKICWILSEKPKIYKENKLR